MKKTLSILLIIITVSFLLISCNTVDREGLWEDAIHRRDKEFGKGEKTIEVQVIAGENSVTFTVNTDADTLGEALLEHGLVEGDVGAYGMYVKRVNGMLADYDVDGTYWSFYENGEMLMTGIDGEKIEGGEHYEIIHAG